MTTASGAAALRLRIADGALVLVTVPIDAASSAAARADDCDLSAHANAKRTADHKSGRTAARLALELAWGPLASSFHIGRTPSGPHLGAPVVEDARGHVVPGMLSISHTANLACAAFAASSVGVDLVRPSDVDDAVAREALSTHERAAWRAALPQTPSDAVAFAAKEAAVKLLRRGFGLSWVATTVMPEPAPISGTAPLRALAKTLGALAFGVRVQTPDEETAVEVDGLTCALADLWLVVLLARQP